MLYPNSLVFMQRLQQAAGNGQYYYTTGETDLAGFERLGKKFAIQYETELTRQTKHKRRRAGEATASLYGVRLSTLPNADGQIPVYWVLMAAEGIGRVHNREQLQNLRESKSRLIAGGGRYELVHDGISWSWRLTHRTYNEYRERIHRVAALDIGRRRVIEINDVRHDVDAERLLDQLYSEPGFRLLRRQVGRLVVELRGAWKRLRPNNGPQLSQRTFLPYVRFLPNK